MTHAWIPILTSFAILPTNSIKLPCQGRMTGRFGQGSLPIGNGPLNRGIFDTTLGPYDDPNFQSGRGGDFNDMLLNLPHKPSPTACCGDLPYDSNQKGCCPVPDKNPVVYNLAQQACCNNHIIDTKEQGCCSGAAFNKNRQDCCKSDTNPNKTELADANSYPGCRCDFSEWTGWSECTGFANGYQERARDFSAKPGYEGKSCPKLPRRVGLVARRDHDGDGRFSCVENQASEMQKKLFGSKYYKDLIILLDESTSIKDKNFEFAKDLVVNIVKSLCGGIGPDLNRVAVIRYSARVKADINLLESVSTESVVENVKSFKYQPIKDKKFSGSTWTASAMNYIYDEVLTPDQGWRRGVGPSVCNGMIIGDSCYFVSQNKGSWDRFDEACGMESSERSIATPVRELSKKQFKLVKQMLFDEKSEQVWLGIGFNEETQTWIYEDGSQAVEKEMKLAGTPWNETFWINGQITSKNSKSNCMSFGSSGMKDLASWVYELDECSLERQFLCKRKPIDYLSVNTELLLITDGRSNDPKKFGLKLDKIKEKFTSIGVQVSAIGVGKINEREIRTLTDNRPGQILYLMSWQSVSIFNRILGRLRDEANFEQNSCLPLDVKKDDLLWQKWLDILEEEGIRPGTAQGNGLMNMQSRSAFSAISMLLG